jgi:REP-associated tyrosine transposase
MARPLRDEEAGMTYHVTACAVDEGVLVLDDGDRQRFLARLEEVAAELGWIVLAVCLLETHYHLLVTIKEKNLSKGIQRINGAYAQWFNRKYKRRGHLFGGRFYGGRVRGLAHYLLSIRYIARNARDKGEHPAHYEWSSYPGLAGTRPCWPFIAKQAVLAVFGTVERLRQFVEDDKPIGPGGGAPGLRPP